MKNADKKEWAMLLITREGYTQKEAAEKVGISKVTMNKWYADGNWERLKQSMLVTRETQLSRLYMQMDELNTAIMNRPEGERFANSKEADTLSKLAGAIEKMESDASIAETVEVGKRFTNWLRSLAPNKAKEVAAMFDDYIKNRLKN
jgi:transcriptional regulator with XRE-family HTH domain